MSGELMRKVALFVICLAILAGVSFLRLTREETLYAQAEAVSEETGDIAEDTAENTPEPEETASPAPTPTPSPSPAPDIEPVESSVPPNSGMTIPRVDMDSWELILVNADNPIGDYEPELAEMEWGAKFDKRALPYLQAFMEGAKAEGLSVYLSSAYRSYVEQDYLFNRKVSQLGGNEAKALTIIPRAGTSEHQTGLCADITDKFYELKTESLENTKLFQWMYAHCAEYGFILRYPKGKEDVTGIIYEPWHFRYVGKEVAEYIMENGITLEEFLDLSKNVVSWD